MLIVQMYSEPAQA